MICQPKRFMWYLATLGSGFIDGHYEFIFRAVSTYQITTALSILALQQQS